MKGCLDFVGEATAVITTISVIDAAAQIDGLDAIFVDVRSDTELVSTGILAGAVHVPRGMLEFVIDPTSPYHNSIFGADKTFIFYCASGRRSALAAQRAQEMGLARVAHIGGGLKAWKEAGYALVPFRNRSEAKGDAQ